MVFDKPFYTTQKLADYTNALLVGDPNCLISGISTLKLAGQEQLSFLSNLTYEKDLANTDAGCVILHPSFEHLFRGNKLVTEDPYYAYALISQLFVPVEKCHAAVHSSVVVGDGCNIASNVLIAPYVVIGANVTIAEDVIIGAGCYIGDNTIINEHVVIHSNVSIYRDTYIGKNTIIHSHVVIGSDGFGFAPNKKEFGSWQKIYQLGGVDIGEDVEIGAGTTIDRGALNNTVISRGVKLDNQIQIAHNVVIGEHTAIAGATAIAGSTTIGKRCRIAGAVGIVGHLTIADDVCITAMTMVTKSIHVSGSYSSGTPMNKTSIWRKNAARFNRLESLFRKVDFKK
jgi:UDP-3-O-[3-hydroxymyristoyl] glucosamine N-acyltransferase